MQFTVNGKCYDIQNPDFIETPRLCVFEHYVDENITRMKSLLQSIDRCLSLANLCPHVKTHKSSRVTQKMLKNGISFVKVSMNELDMLIQSGADKIFVAYPLMPSHARKIAEYSKKYPNIQFYVQLDCMEHAEIFYRFKETHWHYFIDVNIGMDRTGLPADQAIELYSKMQKYKDRLHFAGLHAYDGHVHQISHSERQATSLLSMDQLIKMIHDFEESGINIDHIITAGTPGFLLDAAVLTKAGITDNVYYSPGTWIYSDSFTEQVMPDTFHIAALILAQIIDKPTDETATLNLGHKRWAVDAGPVEWTSIPGAQLESWSEEHTVIRLPENTTVNIGDYILLAPRHVCSTVNLWGFAALIDQNGKFLHQLLIDARNR